MGLFRKKADPISSRSKELNQRIAKLEAEIQKLSTKPQKPAAPPRPNRGAQVPRVQENTAQTPAHSVRSTAIPKTNSASRNIPTRDPIFEHIENRAPAQADGSSEHYNDLGLRKYDLVAAWNRLKSIFRGPEAHNPKLVSYLAAGSIRGLRPLRYEKRVARNRTIALAVILLIVLWGLIAMSFNNR